MIITRTPFRISFFGGGTDYPPWFREHGGAVLSTTIDKYCYITIRDLPPFFDHKHRIVYSNIENVKSLDEIQHPSVRETFRWHGVENGLELHHDGDLPARSGLGSSSAFTVGLINALRAKDGFISSKQELAEKSIHIEQNIIKENVGSQDQIAAAFGGLNVITFNRDDSFAVSPLILPSDKTAELESHMLLFFTGLSRIASTVAESKIANLKSKAVELNAMREMVDEASAILSSHNGTIEEFGKLLDVSWQFKRTLSDKVSNQQIDEIYARAMKSGAYGAKILGAGGGGFFLVCAHPDNHQKIKDSLSPLIPVPIKFESSGSSVVLYEPSGL